MNEDRIADLEEKVGRLEKGFRFLPLTLLSAIALAVIVFILFG
jgi:hypothetical protein